MQVRKFRITADDWGLTPAINLGILNLAQSGVVRRVSLMAWAPSVECHLNELLQVSDIELGLHLDFTSGFRAGKSLWKTLFTSEEALRGEVRLQLERLQALGVKVQYVDGHHHVHQLPRVRKALVDELKAWGISSVRVSYDPKLWWTRRWPVNCLGLLSRGYFASRGLHFRKFCYPELKSFQTPQEFLNRVEGYEDAEVVTHPAIRDDIAESGIKDPYQAERVLEYLGLRALQSL